MVGTESADINFEQKISELFTSTQVQLTKQDNLNTRDRGDTQRIPPGGTPGYAVFNLRYGYQLSEALLLTLALENVTDEEYRIHGSGQNEPGINFVFGASMTF